MAKISSSFKCILCKVTLHFPNDISIVDFIILILQFYKNHEICESQISMNSAEKVQEKKKRKIKN
jgi:hypothetical protein